MRMSALQPSGGYRGRRARRVRMRRLAAGLLLAAAVTGGAMLARSSGGRRAGTQVDGTAPSQSTATFTRGGHAAATPGARRRGSSGMQLTERAAGHLPAAVEDAGAAALGESVVLAGGLTAQDTSTSQIHIIGIGAQHDGGSLPAVQHDAPAVALGDFVYLFGGGDGIRQLDHILRLDPRSGQVTVAGRLPVASSDASAAIIGATAYVVGGYTGVRWLNTILAFRPGRVTRIVARLPAGIRYAAVATAGSSLVIAGGTLPDGSASRAVYRFDPDRGSVRRLATLRLPTTHAAAAALGRTVFVIGGRGALAGSVRKGIVAVDAGTGRTRPAGSLRSPRSDLSAVATKRGILIAGGATPSGATNAIGLLVDQHRSPRRAARPARVDVYAADGANALTGAARSARALVYVPNSQASTLDVIDQRSMKVIAHYDVGALPQHVTPSYDLRTLYVDNDLSNSLTPIDPVTGRPRGRPIPVTDPYNLYFTPGGRYAIVVSEARARLDFRTAHGMRLTHSLAVPCRGVDHLDFTADGSRLLASCEFSGELVVVDVARQRVVRTLRLPFPGSMPQDVKLSPDGRTFFVADMRRGGVWLIDARRWSIRGFLATGAGAHGLYPSRDARELYVTNRAAGSITVMNFATHRIVAVWRIPNGTPDMGGVSADGRTLWLSGRYRAEVYAIDTRTGRLRARIPVGSGPHGLCVWPQPGRYSLGHTGILR